MFNNMFLFFTTTIKSYVDVTAGEVDIDNELCAPHENFYGCIGKLF